MAIEFEFVHSSPGSDLKPGKSLQIRRRCMQGKNRKPGSRRSRQDTRRHQSQQENADDFVAKRATNDVLSGSFLETSGSGNSFAVSPANWSARLNDRILVLKSLAANITDQSFSPLDRWIDFGHETEAPFEWLYSDSAFLHSILTASSANHDFKTPGWSGSPSAKTTLHLHTTLSMLQMKMCNEYAGQHESAVYVVLNLAMVSAGFGDFKAAATHLKGLQRIVQMKGGHSFLRRRPKLYFKLDRIDLIWALCSGKQPFFQQPSVIPVPWDLLLPFQRPATGEGTYSPSTYWDARVATVFGDLQNLSRLINQSVRANTSHDGLWFQEILNSIQARLMSLDALLEDPVLELVRLAMLAFLIPMFEVSGCKMPFDKLADRFRIAHEEAASSLIRCEENLVIWTLIVAAPVTGAQDTWVQEVWEEIPSGFANWRDVKDRLMHTMWIEVVHDRLGEVVFDQLQKR